MELLVTLRNTKDIEKLKSACDGFIVGNLFSSGYHFTINDISNINKYCKQNNIKLYIAIENFISEDDKVQLLNYMDYINRLDVDGIYFHDFGVCDAAKTLGMKTKLIYDGQTIICNSLDVNFYLSKGIDSVVLSRELTLSELTGIVKNNPECCDLMIFGHPRMSYSKRKFLTNYFKQINTNYDFVNSESLYLVEEKRDYKLPIIEEESGTKIYTDYVYQMYAELPNIKQYIKRGIVDTLFIDDDRIATVLRDLRRVTNENASFLYENLTSKYPDNYSTGYLYQKTNITKDE